jgi:hypothetical protein
MSLANRLFLCASIVVAITAFAPSSFYTNPASPLRRGFQTERPAPVLLHARKSTFSVNLTHIHRSIKSNFVFLP